MKRLIIVLFSVIVWKVSGHGMLLDPPNRSSLWRFDKSAPANYNDNENSCGGLNVQWNKNDGNCGVCGDNYMHPHPQPNENTGTYGQGKIVAEYESGELIKTRTKLTTNHLGYFKFHLCELEDENAPESGEDCFKPVPFEDDEFKFQIKGGMAEVINKIQLPKNFTCDHCVLRWTYVGAYNWGYCDDGRYEHGCGPQITFRSCSDITIV